MMKPLIMCLLVLLSILPVEAQDKGNYGFDEGCLTLVSVGNAISMGDYDGKGGSFYLSHITPFGDNLYLGGGLGFHRHSAYKCTSLPIFLDVRYFFLDRPLSPFVALKAGTYIYLSTDNVNTGKDYSIQKGGRDYHLFGGLALGAKWRVGEAWGLMASLSCEEYYMRIYNREHARYNNRFVGDWALHLGVYFQIKGF